MEIMVQNFENTSTEKKNRKRDEPDSGTVTKRKRESERRGKKIRKWTKDSVTGEIHALVLS